VLDIINPIARALTSLLVWTTGVGRNFFREGPIVDFSGVTKMIFYWGDQNGKFHFNHSKLAKQTFLLKI